MNWIDTEMQRIKAENAFRDKVKPIGAVFKNERGYQKIIRHGSTINTWEDHSGGIRRISSGCTYQKISRIEYMKAVFLGKKIKEKV